VVRQLPAKRVRVEVSDDQGNRYTMTFQGSVTREKALRLLDMVELLGGMQNQQGLGSRPSLPSKFDRLLALLRTRFPLVWFSSNEAFSAYEHEFHEPVSLSTVSTYLARMVERGLLMKTDAGPRRKYKLCDWRLLGGIETGNAYT
jgi:hypothetical protein